MLKPKELNVYFLCGIIFTVVGFILIIIGIYIGMNLNNLIFYGTGDVQLIPVIFCLVGIIISIIGVFLIRGERKNSKTKLQLIEQGHSIIAEITGVVPDYSFMINRRPSYRIECRYTDPKTGKVYFFDSETLAMNPSNFITQLKIRVYIESYDNFSNYYVDTEPVLAKMSESIY